LKGMYLNMNKMGFESKVWTAPRIYNVPDMDYNDVKAIYYDGLDYNNYKTRVFAYIGFPKSASKSNKVPAIVLAHGGAGMAYPQWVEKWVEKGFAAIAMDLEGNISDSPGSYYSNKQPVDEQNKIMGGPSNLPLNGSSASPKNQWMYHAVADTYLAHSLLANDQRVDSSKIGICGISWGGIITSVAISNSNCFAFAIPIYGCAYIKESKSLMIGNYPDNIFTNTMETTWETETSKWLTLCKTPTLWINSDSDVAFSLDITTQTAQVTPNSNLCIIPNLLHSHEDGWNVLEAYSFALSILKSNKALATITKQPTKDDMKVAFSVSKGVEIKSAYLVYRTDELNYATNDNVMYYLIEKWNRIDLQIINNEINVTPPEKAKMFYVNLVDNQGYIFSTQLAIL